MTEGYFCGLGEQVRGGTRTRQLGEKLRQVGELETGGGGGKSFQTKTKEFVILGPGMTSTCFMYLISDYSTRFSC